MQVLRDSVMWHLQQLCNSFSNRSIKWIARGCPSSEMKWQIRYKEKQIDSFNGQGSRKLI